MLQRDPSPRSTAARERRSAPRYRPDLLISCHPVRLSSQEAVGALICNISQGGIALLLRQRFESGTVLVIDLGPPFTPPGILARVVHASPRPGGKWLLGCAFRTPLTPEQLQALTLVTREPDADQD